MKGMIALALVFVASTSFAATRAFDIKAQLFIDGKNVSSPRIVTNANEKASISQTDENGETRITVIATDDLKSGGILMKFTVSQGAPGHLKLISQPQILSRAGETAEIAVGENGQPEKMRLKVVATRVR